MPLGLYVHVPFCRTKCDYCDFYSFCPSDETLFETYTDKVVSALNEYAARIDRAADTLYFGGGTPSLLGAEHIARIIQTAANGFGLSDAEITVECNPGDKLAKDFKVLKSAGVNRVSIGAQSANDNELKLLSRRHTFADTVRTVESALSAGISNISLDLMLGIPGQTRKSLESSINEFLMLPVDHISAYMLKVEPGTPMEKRRGELPDDDTTASMYLDTCDRLKSAGFRRYEISNFCKNDKQSRHNLKYWRLGEYFGIGPSAHSFLDGKRFYYGRSLDDFMAGKAPVDDGGGGGEEEFIMLNLRLDTGLLLSEFSARYGHQISENAVAEAEKLCRAGFMEKSSDGDRFSLTDRGALVSNSCISSVLARL